MTPLLFEMPVKGKYQSYWRSNPLALTIYVNADELHSSPHWQQCSRHACAKRQAMFHPRG